MGRMHATTPPSARSQVLDLPSRPSRRSGPSSGESGSTIATSASRSAAPSARSPSTSGEALGSDGGNRLARFSTAAGSNAEVRAALRVAIAWGYVSGTDVEPGEQLLDRIAAILYRLGARR